MLLIDKKMGCALLAPKIVNDLRGIFCVPFSASDLKNNNLQWEETFQLNHSFTIAKGTVRGPNYQDPYPQAKVIRCVRGSLYSVGICLAGIDKGKWVGFELTAKGIECMYIPRGYAHGFVTLEDNTELEYLTDNRYCFEAAKSIKWDKLGIDWTLGGRIDIREELLSPKNINAPEL